jgi:hypothetical protein
MAAVVDDDSPFELEAHDVRMLVADTAAAPIPAALTKSRRDTLEVFFIERVLR